MDPEAPAQPRNLPWQPFAVASGVGATLALLLNVGLWFGLGIDPADEVAEAAAVAAAEEEAASGAVALTFRKQTEAQYVAGILGRNIFDPEAIGKEDAAGGGGGPVDLRFKLRGTIVVTPEVYSAAFIEEEGKNVVLAYGIGQTVGNAEIVAIERDRVLIRRGSNEEWVSIGGGKEEAAREPGGEESPVNGEGVTQESETRFTIERSVLDAKLADLAALQKEARALLHRGPDGEYDGYRLSAIRRGSMLDQIGVRNGDIVHSVNDLGLNSVDGALKALDQLKGQSALKVQVTRRGQPVTLEYDVK